MMPNDITRCDRMGNTCPSRNICARYTEDRNGETVVAALNMRRHGGSDACDMLIRTAQSEDQDA